MCKQACTRKIKIDSFGLRPTERATVQHGVIYSTFNGFFLFAGREKTKKRCGGAVGRRDDDRGCWRGAGARAMDGGGMAGGVPVVLVVVPWCSDNQSISLHRFRGGEGRRGGLFLHRCNIAPAAAVDRGRWW